MIVLILGTPDSGKSKKAEDRIIELSGGMGMLYIATMIPYGKEGKERVLRHRKMRDGKGFTTIECPTNVDKLISEIDDLKEKSLLLECMSNLAGNEMHEENKANWDLSKLSDEIVSEVMALGEKCKHLVIVSNYFSEDDEGYDEDTIRYVKLVNKVNRLLKEKAGEIHELTEGEWKVIENH